MRILEPWEYKLNKSAKRREAFEYFGIGFGSLVMQIVLLFQFGAGGFRNLPLANYIANLLITTISLSTLTLIIYPKWYFMGVKKLGHFVLHLRVVALRETCLFVLRRLLVYQTLVGIVRRLGRVFFRILWLVGV